MFFKLNYQGTFKSSKALEK